MTSPAVSASLYWLKSRGVSVPPNLRAGMIKAKLIHSREYKAAGDYAAIRDELWNAVYEDVSGYLGSTEYIPTASRPMAVAVSKAYIDAMETAYEDGGGDLPVDEETAAWAKAELDAQLSYVDSLFQTLKGMRKEGDADPDTEGANTADRWAGALDGFYNAVKLAGAGNRMLTWTLGDTEQHCDTCQSLDGQRHRASWYSSRGYYPRKPGSATDCGGWRCDCSLIDDSGEEFTI